MKGLRVIAVLVVVQGLLVALYLAVEQRRDRSAPLAMEVLDVPAPPLVVQRDGDPVAIPEKPYLVHFWATWCAPCLEELPALVQACEAEGVPLLAVTDEPWPVVQRHFGGQVPDAVVMGDPVLAQQWGVSGLPDSFVVVEGRIVARMGGPRDWHGSGARTLLGQLRGQR